MNPTWKAAIGVILIFILGWFGGALTTLVIAHHRMVVLVKGDPEALARLLERQTTRGLHLDDSQKKQLHVLFVENLRERMQLQKQIQPQVKIVNGQTLQEIDALLTPDQQQKFQDNLLLFKARYGRNPLNTGADATAAAAGNAPASPATNAAIGAVPAH
jgi:hypothetical protein